MQIPIGISNRHIHLSQADADKLFGSNYDFQTRNKLSQPGEIATQETVTIQGPQGKIKNVRIVIPFRQQTQIEILQSDNFILGTQAPIKLSGNIENTPGITIIGPKGQIITNKGLIVAQRHVHISTKQAKKYGLTQNQSIKIKTTGQRGLIFDNVLVRVKDRYDLDCHIDIDEGNAAGLQPGAKGEIIAG